MQAKASAAIAIAVAVMRNVVRAFIAPIIRNRIPAGAYTLDALILLLGIVLALAPPEPATAAPLQTESDEVTRYELLPVETAQFRIVFDVTATTARARYYFNPIRKGSEASRESVTDRATGEPLQFEVVGGAEARRNGLPDAELDMQFIRVKLSRPVPDGGQQRIRIDKTYKDAASWFREGDLVVFKRSLGVRRNTVVLPAGYEVVLCNVPSQVLTEPGGRIAVSFVNPYPDSASFLLKARRLK
jgi:hypothetical protein